MALANASVKASESWEHHIGQSERGIPNRSSALRMFTELVSDANMEEEGQDAVLRMIRVLKRFPSYCATYTFPHARRDSWTSRALVAGTFFFTKS